MDQDADITGLTQLIATGQWDQVMQHVTYLKAQSPCNRDSLRLVLRAALVKSKMGLASDIASFLLVTNPSGLRERTDALDVQSRSRSPHDTISATMKATTLLKAKIQEPDLLMQLSAICQRLKMLRAGFKFISRARKYGAAHSEVFVRTLEMYAYNKHLKLGTVIKGCEDQALWIPKFKIQRVLYRIKEDVTEGTYDYSTLANLAEFLLFPEFALIFAFRQSQLKADLSSKVSYWLRLSRTGHELDAFEALERDFEEVIKRRYDRQLIIEACEIALKAGRLDIEMMMLSALADRYPDDAAIKDRLKAAKWSYDWKASQNLGPDTPLGEKVRSA